MVFFFKMMKVAATVVCQQEMTCMALHAAGRAHDDHQLSYLIIRHDHVIIRHSTVAISHPLFLPCIPANTRDGRM